MAKYKVKKTQRKENRGDHTKKVQCHRITTVKWFNVL